MSKCQDQGIELLNFLIGTLLNIKVALENKRELALGTTEYTQVYFVPLLCPINGILASLQLPEGEWSCFICVSTHLLD